MIGNLRKLMANNVFRLGLKRGVFLQHCILGRCQNAIESPQNGKRKYDFAVFVALIWASEQIANAPDEVRDRVRSRKAGT